MSATAATSATPGTIPDSAAGGAAVDLTLAPTGLQEFLDRHWGRRPLLVQRDETARFDGILATADAERMVCDGGLRTPAFRLVRDGAQLPLSGYSEDIPWRPSRFSGMAIPARVAAEFQAGATLVLQALQLHWPPAARYCRALELALGCPVQANAYWTPAAAQGFAVHHDTHDVLVLQVSGRKRWRVYEPVLELPVKDQRWNAGLGDPGTATMDFELAPGDTLYLPRGWPHEAETSASDSLHLTIGLHPPTRLDALRAALEECAEDVEFRRNLGPEGELPADLLERLAERLTPDQVARRARRRFVAGRRPVPGGELRQAAAAARMEATTPVARRWSVVDDVDGATLRFDGRELSVPEHASAALRAAARAAAPFTAADLPGPLDEAGRLVLVRRLVREGYLEILSP